MSDRESTKSLLGHIDLIDGSAVVGWAVDFDNLSKNLKLDLVADGVVIGQGSTYIARNDLKELGYGHGRHGFHINMTSGYHAQTASAVKLRESETKLQVKTNAFSLKPSRVISIELTDSDTHYISGVVKLAFASKSPLAVTLQDKDGAALSRIEDCSTTPMGKNNFTQYLFQISTSHLPDNQITEFRLNVFGSDNADETTTFRFNPDLYKHKTILKSLFFAPYYIYTNNISGLAIKDAFKHYIAKGIHTDLNPNPWVDSKYIRQEYNLPADEIPVLFYLKSEQNANVKPSALFSPSDYQAANLDIGSIDPLLHWCQYGLNENRSFCPPSYNDVVLEDIRKTSVFEPDIAFNENLETFKYPYYHKNSYLLELLIDSVGLQTDILVCVPYLSIGGADYISTRLTSVLTNHTQASSITLLVTDSNNMSGAHWLPKGVNVVVMEDLISELSLSFKTELVHKIIANVCPSKIININSHVCWQVIDEYGRFLSQYAELFAYIFCFDFENDDRPVGYVPTYLEESLPYLTGVLSDNQAFIDSICKMYGYEGELAAKFKCAYTPLEENLPKWKKEANSNKVLWCGRLGKQKKIDALVATASLLPDVEFDVYGPPGNSEHSEAIVNGQYKNINYKGIYKTFTDLQLNDYALFLYTSNWDGLPTVLINMMGTGIPVLSTDVGGINELLNTGNSVLVPKEAIATDYAREIAKLMFIKPDTRSISQRAIKDTTQMCSHKSYRRIVSQTVFGKKAISPAFEGKAPSAA